MGRRDESEKTAKHLHRILENNHLLTQSQREALRYAISLLEARAIDAEVQE